MKRLNRGSTKNGPLNQKLRHLYTLKQQLNNAYGHAIAGLKKLNIDEDVLETDNPFYKKSYNNLIHRMEVDLNAVDCLINLCWRNNYNKVPGYEIYNYKICHICGHRMIKTLTEISIDMPGEKPIVECYYCKNCGEKVFTDEIVKRLVDEHKERIQKLMEEKEND